MRFVTGVERDFCDRSLFVSQPPRGALQPQVGLWVASAAFALAHFAPRRDLWPWTLCSFAAGLALGLLFTWTGNLVAPIAAHALINAVNLRVLAVRYAP